MAVDLDRLYTKLKGKAYVVATATAERLDAGQCLRDGRRRVHPYDRRVKLPEFHHPDALHAVRYVSLGADEVGASVRADGAGAVAGSTADRYCHNNCGVSPRGAVHLSLHEDEIRRRYRARDPARELPWFPADHREHDPHRLRNRSSADGCRQLGYDRRFRRHPVARSPTDQSCGRIRHRRRAELGSQTEPCGAWSSRHRGKSGCRQYSRCRFETLGPRHLYADRASLRPCRHPVRLELWRGVTRHGRGDRLQGDCRHGDRRVGIDLGRCPRRAFDRHGRDADHPLLRRGHGSSRGLGPAAGRPVRAAPGAARPSLDRQRKL